MRKYVHPPLSNVMLLQPFRLRASRKENIEVTEIAEVSSRIGTLKDLLASKVSGKDSYRNCYNTHIWKINDLIEGSYMNHDSTHIWKSNNLIDEVFGDTSSFPTFFPFDEDHNSASNVGSESDVSGRPIFQASFIHAVHLRRMTVMQATPSTKKPNLEWHQVHQGKKTNSAFILAGWLSELTILSNMKGQATAKEISIFHAGAAVSSITRLWIIELQGIPPLNLFSIYYFNDFFRPPPYLSNFMVFYLSSTYFCISFLLSIWAYCL